jgi:hypothetical protein
VAGAEVEQNPLRTSDVLSPGDDFPKRIETKSESVVLVEESPIIKNKKIFFLSYR